MSVASRVADVFTIVSVFSRFRKRTTFEWAHFHLSARNLVANASCPRLRSIMALPTRTRLLDHAAAESIHNHASRSVYGSGANMGWSHTPRSTANTPRSAQALTSSAFRFSAPACGAIWRAAKLLVPRDLKPGESGYLMIAPRFRGRPELR